MSAAVRLPSGVGSHFDMSNSGGDQVGGDGGAGRGEGDPWRHVRGHGLEQQPPPDQLELRGRQERSSEPPDDQR